MKKLKRPSISAPELSESATEASRASSMAFPDEIAEESKESMVSFSPKFQQDKAIDDPEWHGWLDVVAADRELGEAVHNDIVVKSRSDERRFTLNHVDGKIGYAKFQTNQVSERDAWLRAIHLIVVH